MSASAAIESFLSPLLPGWRIQSGAWVDGSNADRFAVIKPAGGLPAELVRRPVFTLFLIGRANDSFDEIEAAADAIVEAARVSAGDLIFIQPGEPAYNPTADGRHVFEIAISAITN